VFCPRCGHENADDTRYCVECGKQLREHPKTGEADADAQPDIDARGGEDPAGGGLRALGRRVLGSTRRERIVTGGIVAALAVAAVSVFALPADEEETPADIRDPYIQAVDEICIESKVALDEANQRAAKGKQVGTQSLFVLTREVEPITQRMRSQLASLDPPPEYQVKAKELDAALRRLARAGRRAARYAGQQDERTFGAFNLMERAGIRVQTILEQLGLTGCEGISIR
jgi:hypothetical protein